MEFENKQATPQSPDGQKESNMTNFEKIKNMTKEELAEGMAKRFACSLCPSVDCPGTVRGCVQSLTEWLDQEAEGS